jgi:nitronate monooxygenase
MQQFISVRAGSKRGKVLSMQALRDLLGITIPILNAPMTPQAGGVLARAVSEAGGFGMLGFDEDEREESIEEQVAILQREPGVPFGIGLVAWVLQRRPQLLDLAIAAKPKFISISFGDPAPYEKRVHGAGILLGSQIQSRKSAQAALDAGVDILTAQGTEAGGHTGSAVSTLPLLQIVLEMTDKPVVAAGGIATGRGFAAVLAAGAAGAWIGTPFLLAREARNDPAARQRIAASDETQTIYTRVYDRVQHKGWPHEFGGRALRTPFLERWTGHEDELMADAAAVAQFEPGEKIYAGQSVGLLDRVRPAGEIVKEIATQASALLSRASLSL